MKEEEEAEEEKEPMDEQKDMITPAAVKRKNKAPHEDAAAKKGKVSIGQHWKSAVTLPLPSLPSSLRSGLVLSLFRGNFFLHIASTFQSATTITLPDTTLASLIPLFMSSHTYDTCTGGPCCGSAMPHRERDCV